MSFFKGSDLARTVFGQKSAGQVGNTQPLLQHQFYVKIIYDPLAKPLADFILKGQIYDDTSLLIKNVTMPSFSIDAQEMNQYNRKRIIQTKIKNKPVTINFHDVMGGLTLSIWRMNYMYYFNDGLDNLSFKSSWIANPPWDLNFDLSSLLEPQVAADEFFSSGTNFTGLKSFGYSGPVMRYLFKKIEIFQISGGKFTKVSLFNPTITDFDGGQMDYSSSDPAELSYTFDYEWAEYENGRDGIDSEGEIFSKLEQSNVLEFEQYQGPEFGRASDSEIAGQPPIENTQGAPAGPRTTTTRTTPSSLDSQVSRSPTISSKANVQESVRDFSSKTTADSSGMYQDIRRP